MAIQNVLSSYVSVITKTKFIRYHCTVFHNWKPILKLPVHVSERHSEVDFTTTGHGQVMTGSQLWHTTYRGADKSLARTGRKQATATEDFDVHISYL
jgi:hypothetical protein